MSARHPNRRRLQRWLDTGGSRRVDNHIAHCAQCQEVLETISALDEELVADLQAATTPPEDLRDRTHHGVDIRLRNEAALGTFLDLFAIAWEVTRSMLDPAATRGDETGGEPHGGPAATDENDGGPQ